MPKVLLIEKDLQVASYPWFVVGVTAGLFSGNGIVMQNPMYSVTQSISHVAYRASQSVAAIAPRSVSMASGDNFLSVLTVTGSC